MWPNIRTQPFTLITRVMNVITLLTRVTKVTPSLTRVTNLTPFLKCVKNVIRNLRFKNDVTACVELFMTNTLQMSCPRNIKNTVS